ncbi:unnamed protein product [Cylicocyclus nassatus]|uniref:Uncharacterized protein n=1 Tax=Cylicocyclus nassatus TaxID=53992 RepID=A0AA36GYX8_CYLNA|nr:unnamed protein product [Cylicocyclus nassatus]
MRSVIVSFAAAAAVMVYVAVQSCYGTSSPPPSYPASLPGSNYGGPTSLTASNGLGYRKRRLFRNRARRVRL